MNVISMFSGAGGLDLGFLFAGHNIVWGNDFDKYALDTYEKNLGSINKHILALGDITKILGDNLENINKQIPDGDILIGGFPCQGFSIANIDRSMEDGRNYLYLEILKVIKAKNPKFFLLENVKGLENMDKGKILKLIINDLENVGNGYEVDYNVINACDYGVPQNRERVIILGVRKDLKDKYHLPLIKKANKNHLKDFKNLIIPRTHAIESKIKPIQNSVNISNQAFELLKENKIKEIEDLIFNSNIKYSYLTVRDTISDLPKNYTPNSEEILNHDGTKCKVTINGRLGNRATKWDNVSPTIMGRGSGTGGPLIIPHPDLHRRMSVREVARLQSFPDLFEFLGSNSAKYRQIGNAVPPLMAYHIAKIFDFDNNKNKVMSFQQNTLF